MADAPIPCTTACTPTGEGRTLHDPHCPALAARRREAAGVAEKLNYHLYEGIGPRHLHKDTPLKSMLVGGSSGKMVSRVAYYKAQRENGFAAGDHNWWKDGSGGYITKRTVPIAVSHPACPSHCCAKHGCKYGYDDCPVVLGLDPGIECERCELDADVHKACDDRIEELEARLADYEKES